MKLTTILLGLILVNTSAFAADEPILSSRDANLKCARIVDALWAANRICTAEKATLTRRTDALQRAVDQGAPESTIARLRVSYREAMSGVLECEEAVSAPCYDALTTQLQD